MIAVGVVALLLVVGAAGYAVIHFMGKSGENTAARTDPAKDTNGTNGSDLAAGAHEIGRYWVQLDTPNKSEAILGRRCVVDEFRAAVQVSFLAE